MIPRGSDLSGAFTTCQCRGSLGSWAPPPLLASWKLSTWGWGSTTSPRNVLGLVQGSSAVQDWDNQLIVGPHSRTSLKPVYDSCVILEQWPKNQLIVSPRPRTTQESQTASGCTFNLRHGRNQPHELYAFNSHTQTIHGRVTVYSAIIVFTGSS